MAALSKHPRGQMLLSQSVVQVHKKYVSGLVSSGVRLDIRRHLRVVGIKFWYNLSIRKGGMVRSN